MLRTRIIPTLLLQNESLVKTVRFKNFTYVGDPCNTVRIFNELEVDELIFLDIMATPGKLKPNFSLLAEIASECFMPLTYGGGICSLEQAKAVFDIGFEKVALNSAAVKNPVLITEIAKHYGSQAVIVSIDVKDVFWKGKMVCTAGGKKRTNLDPINWAKEVEGRGAGEILFTSIDREGTYQGFDFSLIKQVSDAVSIPIIAHGGAGCVEHIDQVIQSSGASAVALGSLVVFQKKGMGVLVNFPNYKHFMETSL
jgi:cyclase